MTPDELLAEVKSWDSAAWILYKVVSYPKDSVSSPTVELRYLESVLTHSHLGPYSGFQARTAIAAVKQARARLDELTPEAQATALALAPSWHGCLEMLLLAATALTKEN